MKEGLVRISLKAINSKEYELMVGDNGVGMPLDFVASRSTTLGTELVHIFTEQLDGTMKQLSRSGTTFVLNFKSQDTFQ